MKEAHNMSPELAAQIPAFEREADELERKATALRQIVAGLRALNGDADAILIHKRFESHSTVFEVGISGNHSPRGRDAVRIVMREHPERLWKVVEIKKEVLRRGWAPTPKAVEGSIARLRNDGEIESPQYGYYRLTSSVPAPTPEHQAAPATNLHCEEGEAA